MRNRRIKLWNVCLSTCESVQKLCDVTDVSSSNDGREIGDNWQEWPDDAVPVQTQES